MIRDNDVPISAIERLSRMCREGESLHALLEASLKAIESLFCAGQSAARLVDSEGREYCTATGEALNDEQSRSLRRRILGGGERSDITLLGRAGWEQAADEDCLAGQFRSGVVVDFAGEAGAGCLWVAFHADHLFSMGELSFLRTIGNLLTLSMEQLALPGRNADGEVPLFGAERQNGVSQGEGARMGSAERLQKLSKQQFDAQESERKRIAGELHDGLGQSLTAIKFSLERCLLDHRRRAGSVDRENLTAILSAVRRTVGEVRRVAMDLHPAMLDDFGLLATLDWLSREAEQAYRLRVRTSYGVEEAEVADELRVPIYRICQEALNNIAKHANAKRVEIALASDGCSIKLRIVDDGRGFRNASLGFGLSSMRGRTELSGGCFTITPREPSGVAVTASWPISSGRQLPHPSAADAVPRASTASIPSGRSELRHCQ